MAAAITADESRSRASELAVVISKPWPNMDFQAWPEMKAETMSEATMSEPSQTMLRGGRTSFLSLSAVMP